MTVRKVNHLTTPTTVRNSSVENLLFELSVPAYGLQTFGGIRMTAAGTILNTSASTGRITLKVKLSTSTGTGGTIIAATTTVPCTTSANSRYWLARSDILAPATSAQTGWSNIDISVPTAGTAGLSTASYVGLSTAALVETGVVYVKMTAELSTASTNFTLVGKSAWIEAVK